MRKVFIDSNVFIIHLRYKRDKKYEMNRKFLDLVVNNKIKGYTSIYNLLEVTGILSFNLSKEQIEEFFINFPNIFNVNIIFPKSLETDSICISAENTLNLISKKMSFMDAVILDVFHSSKIRTFITWNAKDFKGKTKRQVLTPEEFLNRI